MKVSTITTNFSGGELSPRLLGRPDLAKYADSVKQARDVVIYQHGGARGRPGTDYLGTVKDQSKQVRLIPFVYSVTDAYVLEFGDGYMRVWKNGALVAGPYELAMPYSTAEALEVDYTQGADTMFLAINTKPIYRLRRYADNRWTIDQVPFDPVPFAEIGDRFASVLTLSSSATGSRTLTASVGFLLAADEGRTITYNGGALTIDSVTSSTGANVTVTHAFSTTTLPSQAWVLNGTLKATATPSVTGPVGANCVLLLSKDGWRMSDGQKYAVINGGLLLVSGYVDLVSVNCIVVTELTGTTTAPVDSWTLESAVWNAFDGYPRTATLHQQRLVAAGSPKFPQTMWGSRAGLYYDFTKGTRDDDSYSFELGSDEINPIRFLSSNKDLIALTFGGEWTINGGIEKPITPTNIRAVPQAKVGCSDARPEQIDDDLHYMQRGVTMVRTLGWSQQLGGYQSSEASTFSDHLARPGLEQLSYQQSPERVCWIRRTDGGYLSMTVSREQNIRPFTLCTPAGNGVVEQMVTIPEGGEDRTYMIVRRTINGSTKRYVERMNWNSYQDCRVQTTPGSATVTAAHLAGEDVAVVADGVDVGDVTLNGSGVGAIDRSAAAMSIGLRFAPTLKMLPAETGTGMGVSASRSVQVGEVAVLFKDTIGCSVNGQALSFRDMGEEGLTDLEPFTGWKVVSERGWSSDKAEIEISQPQAYPFEVLAVVRRITANPG